MKKLRILFILSPRPNRNQKNEDFYHRIYFLSRLGQLDVFAAKGADFSFIIGPGSKVINAPWSGKLGMLVYSVFFFLLGRKSSPYDVIITEPSILTFCGFIGKICTNAKWVADVWDIPIRCHSAKISTKIRCAVIRFIVKKMYRLADLFVVSIVPDFELKNFNIPKQKMFCINNAIWMEDVENLRVAEESPQDTFTIFCMRSIHTRDMGLDILFRAYEYLNKNLDGLRLEIVGRIPQEIKDQVSPVKSLPNVEFHDFVEHDKLMRMIGRSSVCVIPFKDVVDLSQTYPLKVLEYLSLGKPVVASNIEGISRMIEHGQNGLLFRPGDAQDLAEKVMLLYQDRELREKISRQALQLGPQFDVRVKNKEIFKAIEQLTQA